MIPVGGPKQAPQKQHVWAPSGTGPPLRLHLLSPSVLAFLAGLSDTQPGRGRRWTADELFRPAGLCWEPILPAHPADGNLIYVVGAWGLCRCCPPSVTTLLCGPLFLIVPFIQESPGPVDKVVFGMKGTGGAGGGSNRPCLLASQNKWAEEKRHFFRAHVIIGETTELWGGTSRILVPGGTGGGGWESDFVSMTRAANRNRSNLKTEGEH